MLLNLTPYPIRIGAADSPEIPSSGTARVILAPAGGTSSVTLPDGRSIRVDLYTRPEAIEGLTVGCDIIVPLAVVAAMRELGLTHHGRVFTPAMLREEGGVRYAPTLIEHIDVSSWVTGRSIG